MEVAEDGFSSPSEVPDEIRLVMGRDEPILLDFVCQVSVVGESRKNFPDLGKKSDGPGEAATIPTDWLMDGLVLLLTGVIAVTGIDGAYVRDFTTRARLGRAGLVAVLTFLVLVGER